MIKFRTLKWRDYTGLFREALTATVSVLFREATVDFALTYTHEGDMKQQGEI